MTGCGKMPLPYPCFISSSDFRKVGAVMKIAISLTFSLLCLVQHVLYCKSAIGVLTALSAIHIGFSLSFPAFFIHSAAGVLMSTVHPHQMPVSIFLTCFLSLLAIFDVHLLQVVSKPVVSVVSTLSKKYQR